MENTLREGVSLRISKCLVSARNEYNTRAIERWHMWALRDFY